MSIGMLPMLLVISHAQGDCSLNSLCTMREELTRKEIVGMQAYSGRNGL